MRHVIAKTKNIRKLRHGVNNLINRSVGTEGIGLVWGDPGEGKTTAVVELYNEYDGVFVRATRSMTVNSMLGDVCIELGGSRASRNKEMLDFIVTKLNTDYRTPRPIFVDEADYCLRDSEMIDTWRDIYDLSGSPVIFIGMEDIARRLRLNKKVARRVTQWMEFKGLDLDDTRIVAESCAEVAISEDLLQYLHAETGANIGRIIIGLTRIEKFALANRINKISCTDWGDRPLYFDQPVFTRKNAERAAGAR
jgi:DNA transposition AAA+ family ATPase